MIQEKESGGTHGRGRAEQESHERPGPALGRQGRDQNSLSGTRPGDSALVCLLSRRLMRFYILKRAEQPSACSYYRAIRPLPSEEAPGERSPQTEQHTLSPEEGSRRMNPSHMSSASNRRWLRVYP